MLYRYLARQNTRPVALLAHVNSGPLSWLLPRRAARVYMRIRERRRRLQREHGRRRSLRRVLQRVLSVTTWPRGLEPHLACCAPPGAARGKGR